MTMSRKHDRLWGKQWHGARVRCWCDNQAAVHAVSSRSCRDPTLMHLLRCLFSHYQFDLVAAHISGRDNTLADDLSRNVNVLSSFLSKAPQMDPLPSPLLPQIPPLLLDLTDWTLPRWMRQFSITFTDCSLLTRLVAKVLNSNCRQKGP